MAYEIVVLAECEEWMLQLGSGLFDRVAALIDLLSQVGPALGRPAVDSIKTSRHHNMKELRSGNVRILFAFDPEKQAVLILGGDKSSRWRQWYVDNIPVADDRYDRYLRERAARA